MDSAAAAAADTTTASETSTAARAQGILLVPLSHETFGRVGPAAYPFLARVAKLGAGFGYPIAVGTGAAGRRLFLENATRDTSTTLCHADPA